MSVSSRYLVFVLKTRREIAAFRFLQDPDDLLIGESRFPHSSPPRRATVNVCDTSEPPARSVIHCPDVQKPTSRFPGRI
jgi:hypothetical protein